MLFNSLIFILGFLPVVLAGFYTLLRRAGTRAAFFWLVAASLFFYGWWNPVYLLLLVALMLLNFFCARAIVLSGPGTGKSRAFLAAGVGCNLLILGYFKYADFMIATVNDVTGAQFALLHVVLPLAISFFTFQKIAFLADCYRGLVREDSLLNYMLFVGFFPQLIAGPIVHHQEIMPQFLKPGFRGADAAMMAAGVSLFAIGLFKKAVLADSAAISANIVYGAAEAGEAQLNLLDAWGGALAYSLQIYFDFSGYSDMAIGLALMFGVRLPENFRAPYQATGMIEFWRRWHITLSRFLRDYLYVPLGGNRCGRGRQAFNVIVTMLLGGLWHGANWTFVLWGLLHGAMIAVNHGLRHVAQRAGLARYHAGLPRIVQYGWRVLCVGATFALVTVLWVFFRAQTLGGALAMLEGLGNLESGLSRNLLNSVKHWTMLGGMTMAVLLLPNSMALIFPAPGARTKWTPSLLWAVWIAAIFLVGVMFMQSNLGEEFIYFDF